MNGTNYEVPHCGAFPTPHSHPSWAQIFASGSCFQIPLAWIPPLIYFTNKKRNYILRENPSLNLDQRAYGKFVLFTFYRRNLVAEKRTRGFEKVVPL